MLCLPDVYLCDKPVYYLMYWYLSQTPLYGGHITVSPTLRCCMPLMYTANASHEWDI